MDFLQFVQVDSGPLLSTPSQVTFVSAFGQRFAMLERGAVLDPRGHDVLRSRSMLSAEFDRRNWSIPRTAAREDDFTGIAADQRRHALSRGFFPAPCPLAGRNGSHSTGCHTAQ